MNYKFNFDWEGLMGTVKERLAEHGILFEMESNLFDWDSEDRKGEKDEKTEKQASHEEGNAEKSEGKNKKRPKVKVVCVAPDLQDSVKEMGASSRDQVVMVRVDGETAKTLDAWVATGAVKSRSEAAALFIREGLKVRASELDKLKDALNEVEEAKQRLQREAREVFGREEEKE